MNVISNPKQRGMTKEQAGCLSCGYPHRFKNQSQSAKIEEITKGGHRRVVNELCRWTEFNEVLRTKIAKWRRPNSSKWKSKTKTRKSYRQKKKKKVISISLQTKPLAQN